MIDQGNFRVVTLALIIIGLMTCSLPQSGSMQLWADVSEAEPVACIEDVSVISELARVNDAGYESGDTDTRIDSLIERESRVWVIQRCTALWSNEARLVGIVIDGDMRAIL